MHSPFIYDFITTVMNDRQTLPDFQRVEALRKKLEHDTSLLTINDLGAGSAIRSSATRSIASIARTAAKPAKFGQLLYRIARKYQPSTIIELGTSLGLTTSYLALGNPAARVYTMEGAKAVATEAGKNLSSLGLRNIEIVEGNFDDTLQPLLQRLSRIDLAFVDGNHRLEPTLRYFTELLPHLHNDSILIFDDIHWSDEMDQAWEQIRQHPSTSATIDLFFIGLVFFRREFKEKRNFSVRF